MTTLLPFNILLADDDKDDLFFFEKVLKELSIPTSLSIVKDGEDLMKYLFEHLEALPDVLFLDLNMPRKTGFECLSEIKQNEKLKRIPIIVFSTFYSRDLSYERDMRNLLNEIGADDYIRKLSDPEQLKQVINDTIVKIANGKV